MIKSALKYSIIFAFFVNGLVHADIFGRFAGGSWHDQKNTWRIDGNFVEKLPGSADAVQLVSQNKTIELSDSPVIVKALNIGTWDPGLTQKAVLVVRTNLTAEVINIGFLKDAPNNQWGNGELVVSGAEVATKGITAIGGMGSGTLTVSNGGVFRNNTWRIALGKGGKLVIDDGVVSMKNGLTMEEGSVIHINGKSQLQILGINLSRYGSPVLEYIQSGRIFGNGTAGNVQVIYDGDKTIIRVPAGK